MINRFIFVAFAATFALTGCAKTAADKPATDFSKGATVVNVTHLEALSADGSSIYVTVDGNDAGALGRGDSLVLHVPAGKHQVGGYARSLVGHVSVPPVEITTTSQSMKHVAYTVKATKPTFTELPDEPLPQPQEKPKATEAAPATQATTEATPADTITSQATSTPADTSTSQATSTPADTSTSQTTTTPADTGTSQTTTTPADTITSQATSTPADTSTSQTTTTPADTSTSQATTP
ncbi:hypothetical protein Sant_P0205 (plasmid) [Sodalis praecaptivus]|uniref:Lipoprotein n=1 Tax=Sodalis praecaptivus TaxID=1239307 RepID=W0I457_9GAMM|nr:hypothetical protein Sant_P0205 [Sodalis praecaptivus]